MRTGRTDGRLDSAFEVIPLKYVHGAASWTSRSCNIHSGGNLTRKKACELVFVEIILNWMVFVGEPSNPVRLPESVSVTLSFESMTLKGN